MNLRKRVATVSYEGVNDGNPVSYDYASYYSYDIHGNVKTLWQHNNTLSMSVPTQMIKRIDYEYDLISGKVNLVRYQDGAADCFYHFYVYDGDNRITDVYTSNYPWNNQQINSRLVEKNPLWSREAKYFYYAHGPLARVEVGEFMSQGIDYAYTLQGWLKGVNSDALDPGRDMGKDGAGTGTHTMVGRDAFGYSLNYYAGDYAAIESTRWSTLTNRFESGRIGSQLFGARSDLYNGNISAMVTNISQPKSYSSAANEFPTYQAQGGAYKYDKLNRIKQSLYYQNLNTTTNQWNTSGLNPARYLNTFLYDGNGNITHQYRLNGGGGQLDSLSYKYKRDASGKLLSNRLNYVTDAAPSGTATDDLETQVSTNYGYDEMGNLQKDEWEQIDTIKWNVYGKIKSIRRATASIKSNFEFVYDGSGNRVAKIEKPDGTAKENGPSDQPLQWKITYYVRDAQGNIMGNYYYTNSGGLASYKLLERNIYGSSRLGTENTQIEMIGAPGAASPFTRTLGNKYFEGSNHLGNVLCIFTDKKIPRDDNSNQIIDYYQPEVLASNDYTVFGAPMQGRTFNSGNYRYGFNGKEKDDEVVGNGNRYDFDKRIYDPRLGRFLSIDPLTRDYPWSSPYVFAANNPIRFIDIAGMGPGDVFKTPEEAAIDFGKSYNDNSIGAKKEYATTIIKVTTAKGVYYSYVQPSIGNEASSRPSTRGLAGQETVARAHTHGSYSPKYDNEVFSPADINNATNQNVDSYVATPGGTLQKFEVATKNITTIATDIPSDPNSPANERVNKIDPVPLPKNEPTYGTWEFIKHNILTPLLEGAGTIQNKAPGSNKQETSPGQQDSPAADQQDTSDDEFQRPSK